MAQIGATPTGSYARERGSKQVLVGVMDTGVDGTHPDIAPNFDATLSRNFTTDIPSIDGDCEVASCVDPANVDDNDHGTHVASTIGSPINGLGIAGVAPSVKLVNIRAGQDSGYFFLGPVVDALVYAGQVGIDVVNMSFYVDPWLYNCAANPADSPEAQQEQRTIRTLVQRAADYAVKRGVTLVAAMGNESTDLGHPTSDDTSPDYPADAAYHRDVDNSCLTVPTETRGVIAVTSTGPSLRKAYYSNYGTEQADIAAPGGDAYDNPAGTRDLSGVILAAYPESLALETGAITEPGGAPVASRPEVIRNCQNGTCAYYQYLQGTSMASPHAVGVAALIVSKYGKKTRGGVTMAPSQVQRVLYATASKKACPTPREYTYTRHLPNGTTSTMTHTCEGGLSDNGFYGHGIVNAAAVASGKR
jgi:subtilisin family serine protease